MSEPKGRDARENKLNQVQKGGLDVSEGEMEGPQVLAYFGTDVDQGKGAVRVDMNGVMGVGAEGSDEIWGCGGVEVLGPGDVLEESTVDKFLRRKPDVSVLLVVDHVLMRVAVGREARRGGEEVFEGADFDCWVKYLGRERSGRWRGGRSDGGDGCGGDGGFNNGQGDVLDGDVLE